MKLTQFHFFFLLIEGNRELKIYESLPLQKLKEENEYFRNILISHMEMDKHIYVYAFREILINLKSRAQQCRYCKRGENRHGAIKTEILLFSNARRFLLFLFFLSSHTFLRFPLKLFIHKTQTANTKVISFLHIIIIFLTGGDFYDSHCYLTSIK